jgi:hypothetical protein
MSIFYEDNYIVCDNDAITIHCYYFPMGSKRIPYPKIRKFKEEKMDFWTGGGRIWGMGLSPYWFHLDPMRPFKNKCIVIDDGELIKSVITPKEHDRVLQILQENVPLQRLEL